MEIRALTGFDKNTRERYGRSYTPLNGTCNAGLGNIDVSTVNLPSRTAGQSLDTFKVQDFSPNVPPMEAAKEPVVKKFKTPLMVAGGLIAAYLIYKKFK